MEALNNYTYKPVRYFVKRHPIAYCFLWMLGIYFTLFIGFYFITSGVGESNREPLINVLVLTLIYLTLYAKKKSNPTFSIAIDAYTISLSVFISIPLFKMHNESFFVVLNEILATLLIPYAIMCTINELKLSHRIPTEELFNLQKNDTCSIDNTPEAIENWKKTFSNIPSIYINRINILLKNSGGDYYQVIIKIDNDTHLERLYDAYHRLYHYYKGKGYTFNIKWRKKIIVVSWK